MKYVKNINWVSKIQPFEMRIIQVLFFHTYFQYLILTSLKDLVSCGNSKSSHYYDLSHKNLSKLHLLHYPTIGNSVPLKSYSGIH